MTVIKTSGGEDPGKQLAEMLGPGHVDQLVRQAIQQCWMMLPKERRTEEELAAQIRRLVDRALKDYREDREAFTRPGEQPAG